MSFNVIVRLRLLLIGLLLCGAAQARDDCPPQPQPPTPEQLAEGFRQARDRGALWSITRDGRTSYLYGTLHVGRMAWAFPGPELLKALQSTQVLAVEVDATDPGMQPQLQAAMAEAGRWPLSDQERARLDAQADAACLPREALATLHPLMQGITYVVLSGRRDGLDPAFGQEPTLIGFARAQQRPIVSLESIGAQMALLLPKDPAEARAGLERLLGDLESGKSRRELLRVSQAWERSDLQALSSLEKLCECQPTDEERRFFQRLNDDRNPALARRITEEHERGRPVLAAVGLLHMTGPKALPDLLQAQGFEVRRIR